MPMIVPVRTPISNNRLIVCLYNTQLTTTTHLLRHQCFNVTAIFLCSFNVPFFMALPIRNDRIAVNQFKYIMGLGSKAVLERDAHLQIKPNDSNAVLIIDRL